MLGEKVGNLMIYVKQEELGDYEKIKQLVLKQFQPTPRVLLNQFRRSQKLPNENYVQFASRIEAMFDYYSDDSFYVPGPIDCLLGVEIFYELLRSGQIRSENSNLIFQNTVFGFVASGSNSFADTEARVHCGLIKGNLNQTLKMFWELENVDVEKPKNEEAIFCEDHFLKTHSRDEEGRYVVKMPLKNEPNCLGESRDIALKRLNALWTRLIRDPQYLKLYRDFIHEYDQLGHMKEVVAEHDNSEVAYYMPHHGVLRPEKSTTKLRVVFNATNPTSNGLSLNSIQYNGGLVQNDLFTIMIKFREHPYAFTADVKMMYRMILIHESQQPLLRILWKESPEDPVKTFEMKTVTYGTVSAPFLATITLLQLSRDEEKNFPLAAPVLRENFYMDDVLCGAASLMEAKALKNQLHGILKKGGMELHKWGSSHPELASNILEDYEFENPIETKTLGVSWKSQEDCFIFKIAVELKDSYTKRCGLWSLKIDWIDELPSERAKEWHRFLEDFNSVRSICIGRCIVHPQATRVELHGFADASEKCYGAVIYCRSQSPDGATTVKLVISKSRVAPVKSVTMPQLELCAAVLLAKLMKRVETALQMKTPPVYLWSDSTIVLAWIQKEPNLLKTFVANRVATIQHLINAEQWHHVSSEQNPADLVSRGLDPSSLLNNSLWWNGPKFLTTKDFPEKNTLSSVTDNDEFNCEFKRANAELKRLYKLVINPDPELAGFLVDENINWKFLPPRAPNFGGLWEAGVKSFKFHFKREAGNSRFTYEEFLTIMTQIEGILNSRPLTPLSTDIDDLSVLTPAHFLIGRPITSINEPNIIHIETNRLNIYQRLTKIVQSIWKRWSNNYLSNLQQRSKWKFEKDNARVGDLVLIKEDNLAVNKWLMGRLIEVFPGKDNRIRVVTIKTQHGVVKRPISKICILPMRE
ncbi:integrase catalytic domain-containing protein [Trichonephila clavipes]|nr:integrase catalytic domain-containing protein [Trichonephila clavipes]